MLITNARIALSATESNRRDIEIRDQRMYFADAGSNDALDLSGCLLLPGLINAHDHLEFNLFPRLGRRLYANATEWAADIHRPAESPVREHLLVPKTDRLIWGGIRNLLSGLTTVAHHNPYEEAVFANGFPVRVVRHFRWAHSIAFSPDFAVRHGDPPGEHPFIIHAGEGIDDSARSELPALAQRNLLDSRTVLVHGVAFDTAGLDLIRRHRASVVWCPSSNLLTYGQTLKWNRVARIALGTDSAISAAGDMIDELRIAHSECGAAPEALYEMVTRQPADILHLPRTALVDAAVADIIAVPDHGQTPAEALTDLAPELVINAGRLYLVSKRLHARFDAQITAGFHSIALENRGEWLTPFDIPRLLRDARSILGDEIKLAGKRVSQ